VREDLFEWLSERAPWQQDLARRLCDRVELTETELTEVLDIVKAAYGASVDAGAPDPVAIDDLPNAPAEGCPKLVRFGPVRGLGALTENAELRFEVAGLTIIYGPNAVGKSTYVSGLKRICRTVDTGSTIRGNVFGEEAGPSPTAAIEIQGASGLHGATLELAEPEEVGLGAVSVFDAKCAELYLDAQNAVTFVPEALRLLARMAHAQDQLRERLGLEIRSLRDQQPTFPGVEPTTEAGAVIANISSDSDVDALKTLGSLDSGEIRRREEVRSLIASAGTAAASADAQSAENDGTQANLQVTRLGELLRQLHSTELAAVHSIAGEASSARRALDLAAAEFEGAPVKGVGSEPWRHMWEAARDFTAASERTFPPGASDPCPLCLQPVEPGAAERMEHFEAHVRSSIQEAAEQAGQRLSEALARYTPEKVGEIRISLSALLNERAPDLLSALAGLLDRIERGYLDVRSEPETVSEVHIDESAIEGLRAWAAERLARAESLRAAADPSASTELRAELKELDGRAYLGEHINEVETWIERLQLIAVLDEARRSLATNSLSLKQSDLSQALITDEFGARLREELAALRCELPVSVSPHTSVGEAQVRLRLVGSDVPAVSEIASEGEHRAVALSFFLAETGMRGDDGGLIFDDPVSSLDDDRREYIADRIVAEANNRQVIVFTHDLPFMLDLQHKASEAGVETGIQALWRFRSDIGRVDDHPPFIAMNLRARVSALANAVQEWNSQPEPSDFDDAWRRVCDFYARMRTAWERAVEERLFNGVVQRYQRDIKTLRLADVSISPEQVEKIEEGMTRCSSFVHDQPPSVSSTLPGRTDLASDLEPLREFEENTRR
jgi:recombinational DNA repair ATPase RecF